MEYLRKCWRWLCFCRKQKNEDDDDSETTILTSNTTTVARIPHPTSVESNISSKVCVPVIFAMNIMYVVLKNDSVNRIACLCEWLESSVSFWKETPC